MTLSPHAAHPSPLKLLVILFVLSIALAAALPGYLGNHWPWQQLPPISNLKQLRTVQKQGLQLPGWSTLEQKTVEIGGHKWSAQAIVPAAASTPQQVVWVLLRPQTWERDLPQIDWTDINGMQQWSTDSQQRLTFSVESANHRSVQVNARFLRGWTQNRTDAVLQWYAWDDGGDAAPSRWFWADQWMQLQKQRQPWVAVSIQIPIQPLGEVTAAQADAKTLGQLVQSALIKTVFE